MYSRNLDINGINNYRKNNLEIRKITSPDVSRKQEIPVKSFTDNFAYERFNKIDNQLQHKNNERVNAEAESAQLVSDNIDFDKELSVTASNKSGTLADAEKSTVEKKLSIKEILNFDGLYDSDLLFLVFAAAITIFGNKENNDKLTPIALLAIIFL